MLNRVYNLINGNDMKIKNVFELMLIFLLTVGILSCIKDDNNERDKIEIVTIHVSSETKFMKFVDETPVECMIVTVSNEQSYLPLGWINGFKYEKGYEYSLKVKKITPAQPLQDAPRDFYLLIEVLSKEKV